MQAEAIFDCPAYWLAEAYPQGWKYEFSYPPAEHSIDTESYFFSNQTHPDFTDDFVLAFQNVWGNFIVHGDPRISWQLACSNCTRGETYATDLAHWTPYTRFNPVHMSANVTGGHTGEYSYYGWIVPTVVGPGLENYFRVADADTWEGGRGYRCDFWRSVGPRIPG